MKIVFFGSTLDSIIVLTAIQQCNNLPDRQAGGTIVCIVTQPPRPVGRKKVLTPTPVEQWGKAHNVPVLTFASNHEKSWLYEDEEAVTNALATFTPDLLVSACYGQKIPGETIAKARFGGLNVHPSILPRWRGADPVPWAILAGDHQTGVSVVTLSSEFDKGRILAQKKVAITQKDTSDPLRTKLFTIGAELLAEILPSLTSPTSHTSPNTHAISPPSPYARRFTRQDGFIPWELMGKAVLGDLWDKSTIQHYDTITIVEALKKRKKDDDVDTLPIAISIDFAFRALHPWPGVYTIVNIKDQRSNKKNENIEKRLKILACHVSADNHLVIDTVQLEGKTPIPWKQFQHSYLSNLT